MTPLMPSFVTRGIPRFRDVAFDPSQPEWLFWLEQRPDELGRTGLFGARWEAPGVVRRFTPPGFDVRSRVHEYGGAAFWIEKGQVYASSGTDGRLWTFALSAPEGTLRALTPPGPWRFADFRPAPRSPYLYTVLETAPGPGEVGHWPTNQLAAVALGSGSPRILAEGADFYASPRPSPDGARLAWVQWRHPSLPWQGTELVVGTFDDSGAIAERRRVAGGPGESVLDPAWHPDGSLHFVSDRDGAWNLYRIDGTAGAVTRAPRSPRDFGLPHWVFGRPLYGFDEDGASVAAAIHDGRTTLWRSDTRTWWPIAPSDEWTTFEPLRIARGHAVGIAAGPYRSASVVAVPLVGKHGTDWKVFREATAPPRTIVGYVAEAKVLPRRDGGVVHAFLYRPNGSGATPGIVSVHGGPTAQASFAPDATVLFWLSHGFAWLDVNYGGSTGYGRDYRDRLEHRWGELDVADCEDATRALVAEGVLTQGRVVIRGGSSGGYTALRAAVRDDVFAAATAAYGVSDLEGLFRDTHKFEAFYGDWLVGTRDPERLRALSPVAAPERIRIPVLFLQGLDDRVVPPAQSERMYRALSERGLAAEYVTFPGEGHGFRKAETVERALATELAFYAKVLRLRS